MGSPCPPPWTFAGRAAYFGDRICAFCDHRNPAGAKFCNDCASPLHLKPCRQCDAVNDQVATTCSKCGAACPQSSSTAQVTAGSPAADPTRAAATPGEAAVAAPVTQPPFAAPATRAGWRSPRSVGFLVAAITTILVVAAYQTYRVNVAAPDTTQVASEPVVAPQDVATGAPPAAPPAVPVAVEAAPVEPETTAHLEVSIPGTSAEVPQGAAVRPGPAPVPATKPASQRQRPAPVSAMKRATPHQRGVPGTATKRASANQRPVRQRRAPAGAPPSVAHGLAAARARARVVRTNHAPRPDQWQAMHVSLSRCGGDLIARIVCGQRVRRRFCEGRWGEAQECAGGIANEHGQ